MSVDLKSLIDKLNPLCRRALEEAAGLCVRHTHYNVEIEHLLAQLLEGPDSVDTDLRRTLRQYEVERDDLAAELREALDQLQRGNSRTPAFSPHLLQLLQQGWLASSLELGSPAIRTGGLLLALLGQDPLRAPTLQSAPSLGKVPRDRLREDAAELFRGSMEDVGDKKGASSGRAAPARPAPDGVESPGVESPGVESSGLASDVPGLRVPTETPALDQFTLDLTARAREGKIDPIRGRDAEIRQLLDILSRRRQNNPILTGEAGVGKTAVVEGLALRIAAGEVPPAHRNVSLRLLDLGLLQAGAGVKGEFEKRLKSILDEVRVSPAPIILFIDEAHTMIGAGGAAGSGDAANLLKPALARGELRTIAATTWAEYKKYFEKDPALARRFQVVKIDEPSEEAATDMLRGLASHLEEHHGVRVLDEAVRDAVSLSHRYIMGRQLPDKAISVLDTACARVALAQNGTPPAIEEAARAIQRIETELALLKRERAEGHPARKPSARAASVEELSSELARLTARKAELEERWRREAKLVEQILKLQREAEPHDEENAEGAEGDRRAAQRLARLRRELEEAWAAAAEEPMVPPWVDSRAVAAVVSAWTGIPTGKMMTDEVRSVLELQERLAERVVGQDHALDAISRRLHTSRAGLEDPAKPIGVFLLVGPSGVGKTETALALADVLYGGHRHMVTVNLSEFQEAHTVSTLKGAPPGYVGYGTGGVLTEAVRRNPYTVVLLDEMEKAHSDVAELFYQVFDRGLLEDGEGVQVDFRNTVILLTSNAGAEIVTRACREAPDGRPDPERLAEAVRPALLRHFKPALLGRLVVVPYYPLGDAEIRDIVELKLARVRLRLRESHGADLTYGQELVEAVAARCTEGDSGARNVDHILTQTLLPELSGAILNRMAAGEPIARIHVGLDEAGRFSYLVR